MRGRVEARWRGVDVERDAPNAARVVVRRVAALRVAEQTPVRGLVLVAPYYTDLGLELVRRAGWVTAPWGWARIQTNAGRIAIFRGDEDPYVSQAEFAALSQLGTPPHVVPGAGHLSERESFPELAAYILGAPG
jgi:hypothetical protein